MRGTGDEDTPLRRLYRGLEVLYQTETGVDPESLVVRRPAGESGAREQLLLREADDGELEVALVIDAEVLARFEATVTRQRTFCDEHLEDALPVIEGLSHLVYVAEAARRGRPVSGLELETQAEVDKLGLCLLQRWPQAEQSFDRLVDRLYYRFELHPMSDELARRYHHANRVALGFSRRLRPHVAGGRLSGLRRALREFWGASMQDKRALAG
ncbi:hypothetical protein [Paraliomyxa miuraensis]|uniref:hypothetical protein n=1 Tax=Paraliomyxa miuraensis TaxID=376150 RepID=UPI00225072D3|nr:hypothetical protein [Paraliomyxa miuraensis]MCX4245318.1 hypothetical protein [Paraliomyxa miuraensis]